MAALACGIRKSELYLQGLLLFQIVTDHKPLLPLLNTYTLDQINNPRLQRLREKLLPFSFEALWEKGTVHKISDALPRVPITQPDVDDVVQGEAIEENAVQTLHKVSQDVATLHNDKKELPYAHIIQLEKAAVLCPDYKELVNMVRTGVPGMSD